MTDTEAQQILESIVSLAAELGWVASIIQTSEGNMVGMYIGSPEWIESKIGKAKTKH